MVDRFIDEPFLQIPAEFRLPAIDFWMFYSHLLQNQLALACRLRHWIEDGLALEDARSVFAALMRPWAAAKYQFAGQLLADLAQRADEKLDRRKKVAEMLRRREEFAPAADIGKMPE